MSSWSHAVSREWMKARKKYLTGSEIVTLRKALASATKKATSAGLIPAFVSLWGEKHSTAEPDVWANGDAARGHVLEPYAVLEYNRNNVGPKAFHWDDIVVHSDIVGFSPDGLDIEQPASGVELDASTIKPEHIFEIKSYAAKHYYECLIAEPMQAIFQHERQQIAVGMYVCPSIKEGHLILYNPSAAHPMRVITYQREDLLAEFGCIDEVLEQWKSTCKNMEELDFGLTTMISEAQIHEQEMEE